MFLFSKLGPGLPSQADQKADVILSSDDHTLTPLHLVVWVQADGDPGAKIETERESERDRKRETETER